MSLDPRPIPPLVVEFEVAASVEHAFAVWFETPALWWPKGHTISGNPETIVFEGHAGGRIYERAADGSEHNWGEVVVWEAPHRASYLWHLFFSREQATTVDVSFTANASGTVVRLVQTGWEALGDEGPTRRERTIAGWGAVTAPYRTHLSEPR